MKSGPVAPLDIPDALAQEIFDQHIVPNHHVTQPATGKKKVIIIAGHPGSGKTTTLHRTAEQLGSQSTFRNIGDDLLWYLPGYQKAIDDVGLYRAQRLIENTTSKWGRQLFDHAIALQANMLLEVAHPPAEGAPDRSVHARQKHGYRTELHVIATERRISWTAVLNRYDQALEKGNLAGCAIVSKDLHDRAYGRWPHALFRAQNEMLYDRIVIADRDGNICYENDLVREHGQLRWSKGEDNAWKELLIARRKPLSVDAGKWLDETWNRLLNSSKLKADRFVGAMPLPSYRRSISKFVDDQRHPAPQWGKYFSQEISMAKNGSPANSPFQRSLDDFHRAIQQSNRLEAASPLKLQDRSKEDSNQLIDRPQKPPATASERQTAVVEDEYGALYSGEIRRLDELAEQKQAVANAISTHDQTLVTTQERQPVEASLSLRLQDRSKEDSNQLIDRPQKPPATASERQTAVVEDEYGALYSGEIRRLDELAEQKQAVANAKSMHDQTLVTAQERQPAVDENQHSSLSSMTSQELKQLKGGALRYPVDERGVRNYDSRASIAPAKRPHESDSERSNAGPGGEPSKKRAQLKGRSRDHVR